MRDVLKYKEFLGSLHYNSDDEIFYGKLEGIDDLVTFEGTSVEELKAAFHEAVEDYINICRESGKQVYKAFKGSFNIRIKPELHKKAAKKSAELGISLNQLVERAITEMIENRNTLD